MIWMRVKTSLMLSPCVLLDESRSSEWRQISWAYYQNVLRTNEICKIVTITEIVNYFNSKIKICLSTWIPQRYLSRRGTKMFWTWLGYPSPSNSTLFTRPFILMRVWSLDTRLKTCSATAKVGCQLEVWLQLFIPHICSAPTPLSTGTLYNYTHVRLQLMLPGYGCFIWVPDSFFLPFCFACTLQSNWKYGLDTSTRKTSATTLVIEVVKAAIVSQNRPAYTVSPTNIKPIMTKVHSVLITIFIWKGYTLYLNWMPEIFSQGGSSLGLLHTCFWRPSSVQFLSQVFSERPVTNVLQTLHQSVPGRWL